MTPRAWLRTCFQAFVALWTYCTGWAHPNWFVLGVVRAFVWPIYFLANCTRWIGAALAPRARRRRWFQRCAALWADLGGRCLQVGGFPPTLATNAVVGLGVILVQVGHADDVPTRAALPGFCFRLVGLVQFTLFAAGFS